MLRGKGPTLEITTPQGRKIQLFSPDDVVPMPHPVSPDPLSPPLLERTVVKAKKKPTKADPEQAIMDKKMPPWMAKKKKKVKK